MRDDSNFQSVKIPEGLSVFSKEVKYSEGSLIFTRNGIDYVCNPHSHWYSTVSMLAHSFINEKGKVELIDPENTDANDG